MQTCNIMGVNIAVTDMDKTLRLVEDNCEAWRGKYICVANVHTTVTAHDDPTYLRVQNGAVMALPDGGPLSRYSRKKGFADAARVTGPDLMRELLKESGTKHYRHYFYGSTQETLDILREKITEKYPGAVIAGMYSPPFRPLTADEDAEIVEKINAAKPDFVWVGLGAPKQERWMAAHENRVQALMLGVGAAFDYEELETLRKAPPSGEAFCEHRPFLWVAVLFFVCLYALFGFPRSAAKNSVRGWYSAKRPRHILYIYGGLARWLY